MGLFGKHRLVHTRSCKAFAELPPCRWPSRRLLPTIRPASGDGTSRQLAVKRPTRAVEELRQIAATKTERRQSVKLGYFRVADIHVSLCQEQARVFLGRSRERPIH
jgi:hypothetical protein